MGHFGVNGCNGRDSGDERNDWDVCEEAGEDGEMIVDGSSGRDEANITVGFRSCLCEFMYGAGRSESRSDFEYLNTFPGTWADIFGVLVEEATDEFSSPIFFSIFL